MLRSFLFSLLIISTVCCDVIMSRGTVTSFLLLGAALPAISLADQSHHFIVLRVSNLSDFALSKTSALFELTEPVNKTKTWDCKSGQNPVMYKENEHAYRAKSIDLEDRVMLECLGFIVTVMESVRVSVWYGEETPCPGYVTTTDNLKAEEPNKTTSFEFRPNLFFDVYEERPTPECARQEVVLIQTPKVRFKFQNETVSGCYVETPRSALLVCNMSIITGEGDTVSMAMGATYIPIPRFVQTMETSQIECACECRISSNNSYSTTRRDSLGFVPHATNLTVTTAPELLTSKKNSQIILILVYVLAFLFFVSTIMTIVFLHVSRRLHKRLHRVLGEQRKVMNGACGHPASQCRMSGRVNGSATAPPHCFDTHYSTLHRIRNECHHYNTVSLRLSDCIEFRKETDDKPVYQKLNYNHHPKFEDIEEFSMATSV